VTRSRRFVAGAVCPQCRAVDRIVIEAEAEGVWRRCVTCGFTEAQPGGAAPLPATRFSGERPRAKGATPAKPVRILSGPGDASADSGDDDPRQ
jgi:uncharacterized protein